MFSNVTSAQQALALAAAALGLSLGFFALSGSGMAWRRYRRPIDLAMGLAAGVWLMYLLVTTLLGLTASQPWGDALSLRAAHFSFQALIACVSFFLLVGAGVACTKIYPLIAMQGIAGGLALYGSGWSGEPVYGGASGAQAAAVQVWVAVNLLSAALLTGVLVYRAYFFRTSAAWLTLAGGLMGLALGVDHLLLADQAPRTATLSRHFYAAFLLVIWHLISQRQKLAEQGSDRMSGFQSSKSLEPFSGFSGFGPTQDTAIAVACERRRISQELHDGVGSQMVNILSSLDVQSSDQRALALALEQCLVDLKMTVDCIDCADDNVVEALGRLRYRVQYSLDKMGIRMAWKVQMCEELEAVRGMQSQEVLRITQECLANVMRHAQASSVEVVCRFVAQGEHMVLEVRDNGKGIARGEKGRPIGKGMENMRRRAQVTGGRLSISSKTGLGTCVRLTMPLVSNAMHH